VAAVAERIAVIRAGQLVEEGRAEEMLSALAADSGNLISPPMPSVRANSFGRGCGALSAFRM
jgi:ABC-type glutathione transport system ATPase component